MVGGFGFSDRACEAGEWREFPPAWFFMPMLLWVRRGARCTLTIAWEKDDRDSADRMLARALAAAHCLPSVRKSAAAFGTPAVSDDTRGAD